MLIQIICFVLFLQILFHQTFSNNNLEFSIGDTVSIQYPPTYNENFKATAVVLCSDDDVIKEPYFKVALVVEPIQEKFSCSLVEFLGDFKVWASDHFSKFWAVGGCAVELSRDGDLQIKDFNGSIGWRSRSSNLGVKKLVLQKYSGNLILIGTNNKIVWQSFDYPTDTLLWNQTLHSSNHLTVFLSSASFYYTLEISINKLVLYLNLNDRKYAYWEYKLLSKSTISFIQTRTVGLKLFNKNSKKIGQITATNAQAVRFLNLDKTGNLKLYYATRNFNGQIVFESSYDAIYEFCSLPLPCGISQVCRQQSLTHCWQLPSTKYGLACDEMKMVELPGVATVLNVQTPVTNLTKDECAEYCLEDCSCAASMYSREGCSLYDLVGGTNEVRGRRHDHSYWIKINKNISEHHGVSPSAVEHIVRFGEVVDVLAVCFILGGLIFWLVSIWKRRQNARTDNNGTGQPTA